MASGTRNDPYGQFNFLIEIDGVTRAGFSEVSGLTTDTNVIEYREGDRSMFVDSEVLAVGNGMAVFKDSITGWKPPHNLEPINEEKKHEIVSNICRAVGSQGQHVDVL